MIVTVSPSTAPDGVADTAGVLSEVTLSVDELPVSDVARRSGVAGADGAVVSMVIDNGADATDVLPDGSVDVDATDQTPSLKAARSQLVAEPTTYEHDTDADPTFDAVIVTRSPEAAPAADIVGVLSLVTLSEFEVPLSEVAAKSGCEGADGAVVSIVIGRAGPEADVFPAGSATVAATFHVPSASVPRSQLDTDGKTT